MTLKLALWLSGGLGALALLAPGLVAVGMFFIVPGVILLAAPTVFIYLAAFSVIRMVLPLPPGATANVLAAALSLALGWLVAQPFARRGAQTFAAATLPDATPATPIVLRGHIRYEAPDLVTPSGAGALPTCSPLCTALLDTRGVESVTLVKTDFNATAPSVTYRLVPRTPDVANTVLPDKPERILRDLPTQDADDAPEPTAPGSRLHVRKVPGVAMAAQLAERETALSATWAVRLATREALIVDSPGPTADFTIRFVRDHPKPKGPRTPMVDRLEIVDAGGTVLFRTSNVTFRELSAPLHFTGEGGLENFRVGLARRRLSAGTPFGDLRPATRLFRATTLALPLIDTHAPAQMLDLLDAAVADRSLPDSAPAFQLAPTILASMNWSEPLPESDIARLARVIADPRVPISDRFYAGTLRHVSPALRAPLGARIVHADTPDSVRTRLATVLAALPRTTFRTLTEDERMMLGRFALRKSSYPMIPRLADRGAEAMPDLLAILDSDRQISDRRVRNAIIENVAVAFARLGPDGASALPVVRAALKDSAHPLDLKSQGERAWRIALARMGVALDEIVSDEKTPERRAEARVRLQEAVARFEKEIAGADGSYP